MKRSLPKKRHFKAAKKPYGIWELRPCASALLLVGYILMVLSLCDFAARLYEGISPDPALYIADFAHSVSSATAVLWASALGLDWMERKYGGGKS